MLCFKVLTIFLIALCLMPEQVFGHFWWNIKKCYINKCNNYGSPVYGSDGKNCLVFPNSCYFENESCERRNQNIPSLTQVTLTACKKLVCEKDCTPDDIKICGENGGKYVLFDNKCKLSNAFCEEGLVYTPVSLALCK